MMDVKAYKLGQVSNEVADQFVDNVSHLPQLCEIDLRQDSIQQGYSLVDWHKDPRKNCFNEFVRNKMAKNSLQKANPEGGHWTSDHVPGLEGQLYAVDGASKEHMLGKMLPCQLRNVIQHEIRDASFSSQLAGCLTSSFGISNSTYPLDDYSMVVNDDFHTVRTNNTIDSSSFEDGTFSSSKASPSDGYNPEVATTFLAFDGTSVPSPAGIRQVANEMVPSPEQISSITACSDVDVHSDTGPFDGGTIPGRQHLTESSSENYVRQTHRKEGDSNLIEHGGFLKNNQNDYSIGFPSLLGENLELAFPDSQNLQQDPQGSNNLPTGKFDIPISTCEDLFEPKPQMPESEQFHQWHREPYMQVDEPSEVQSQDYLFEGQNASKASYVPSEKSLSVHHVASEISSILFGPTGAAKLLHSNDIRFERILLSYMNYKRTHEDGSQVSFVKHMHSTVCNEHACNCDQYFVLVSHIDDCHQWDCDICKPVRRSFVNGTPPWGYKKQEDDHLMVFSDRDFCCTSADHTEDVPPPKRLKIGNPILAEFGFSGMVDPSESQPHEPELLPHLRWPEPPVSNDVDAMKVKMGISISLQGSISTSSTIAQRSNLKSAPIHPEKLFGCPKERETIPMCVSEVRNNVMDNFQNLNSYSASLPFQELIVDQKEGREIMNESDQEKLETRSGVIALATDSGIKTKEPKIPGVSLIDFFTVEEMREHLSSLRQWIGQDAKGNQMATSAGENSCQLCAMDRLVFAPTPIYCSSCGARIKRSLIYYCALDEMGTRHCFCTSCSKKSRGGEISFHGISISKEKLHKERNIHEDEESWVQCDKCKGWQHQICALYNDKRDLGGNAEYICPNCYLEGIEGGEIVPFPRTVAFGAKDLPTTLLSDHIEQRLFSRLKQEREERAKALQKNSDEVPGATDLVVRVVLSVSKLLKVKQQFLDIFQDENYPTEFPYRSKVILLFQKIEGVDVCLFGMYVQEFGSECGHPNQRSVYISYLDSIKYFRPEIKTTSGEALRTFVYHEILIGYLDYCKKRGFATCYIWACPPLKGEDYILYCHPEAQKTPKSDKLRQWYKSMLRKAAKENIVVDCTNLYDNFFVPTEEHNIKITAARLPYFDGDYWSVAAIDMIKNIEQGSKVGSQGKMKKVLTKRTFKAMGHTDLSHDATKDILLMQKLGQTILPVKEDFIMVHLQFTCTICHELIQSGSRWYCNECKNFQLCARCHDMEQHLNERNICISGSGGKHFITPVAVNYVPPDIEDTDVTIDNVYFENRYSFLSFCQGNHYQFNTLRRAKHSSMMILYHLHNSTVPSVGATCSICQLDIVVNQAWHCEICPGFDACDGCYKKKGGDCHTHKLSQRASIANIGLKNGKAQQHKQIRVREVLDALMHASQCNVIKSNACSYPKCSQIRRLFHHARQCNIRVAGGCQVCQKSWTLLRLHSKNCQDSGCQVPRCMDLKKHTEMLVLQSENRRRAAVVGSLRGC